MEHNTDGNFCWCDPVIEKIDGNLLVIHNDPAWIRKPIGDLSGEELREALIMMSQRLGIIQKEEKA